MCVRPGFAIGRIYAIVCEWMRVCLNVYMYVFVRVCVCVYVSQQYSPSNGIRKTFVLC